MFGYFTFLPFHYRKNCFIIAYLLKIFLAVMAPSFAKFAQARGIPHPHLALFQTKNSVSLWPRFAWRKARCLPLQKSIKFLKIYCKTDKTILIKLSHLGVFSSFWTFLSTSLLWICIIVIFSAVL